MKYVKYLMFIFLLLAVDNQIYSQQKVGKYFNCYFEYIKEIALPQDIILGDITVIDTYKDKILIVDKMGKSVYLINESGKLIKKLNTDDCHPGIKWHPYSAYFNKDGDIYAIYNYPTWGFRFDINGKCIGPVDATFLGTYWYAFKSNGEIIGYNSMNRYNKNTLMLMTKEGKEIKNFGIFPDDYKNMISRTYGGGLVTDKDDNIYQSNVCSYDIMKYDKNGSYIKTLKCRPYKYIAPERDYSNTNNMQQMIKESKSLNGHTNVERLYLLDKDILATEYWYQGMLELTLCDLEGNKLNTKPITYEKQKSLFAKSGYLYFTYQAKADSKGNIPNPTIKVYRFNSNMRGK